MKNKEQDNPVWSWNGETENKSISRTIMNMQQHFADTGIHF